MTFDVAFRPAAVVDLDEIYAFIARDSPGNALAFIRRIRKRCAELAEFHQAAPLHEDLRPGLRLLAFEKRIVIAYEVIGSEILIGRIFYGGRDIQALLSKID